MRYGTRDTTYFLFLMEHMFKRCTDVHWAHKILNQKSTYSHLTPKIHILVAHIFQSSLLKINNYFFRLKYSVVKLNNINLISTTLFQSSLVNKVNKFNPSVQFFSLSLLFALCSLYVSCLCVLHAENLFNFNQFLSHTVFVQFSSHV